MNHRDVRVDLGDARLDGALAVAPGGAGLVIFAHGSGSGRLSPRNLQVAGVLNRAGLSTLLFDLLTPDEQALDERTGELRFAIELLTARLVGVIDCASDCLVPAPVRRQRWGRRRNVPTVSLRWYRAAVVQTWRWRVCPP